MPSRSSSTVYTIGHSNRELSQLLDLLRVNGIEQLVDVRAFPGSRRQPHFGRDQLERSLPQHDIAYQHVRDLGGRRRVANDVDQTAAAGWRNASFRAYALYVQTPAFREALEQLMRAASCARVAIMCSEAVPWRCHRWLICDALVAQGWRALHVIDERSVREHVLSPFAQVSNGQVTWPGPPSSEPLRLGPAAPIAGSAGRV